MGMLIPWLMFFAVVLLFYLVRDTTVFCEGHNGIAEAGYGRIPDPTRAYPPRDGSGTTPG